LPSFTINQRNSKKRTKVAAIVCAAGSGTRLGNVSSGVPKALLKLANGKSLLELTLYSLKESAVADLIVVTSPAEYQADIDNILACCLEKDTYYSIIGGNTRQSSVGNALNLISSLNKDRLEINHVLVHDAARPFVSSEDIVRVVESARMHTSAILGKPISSTIKKVKAGSIETTIPRKTLFEALTPQVFDLGLLEQAYLKAHNDQYLGTDDSELVERLGEMVSVVEPTSNSMKVTTPLDLEVANAIAIEKYKF
jgi:2-C-methyl-D-erythritol 4-phosphate cytidylyltransferase